MTTCQCHNKCQLRLFDSLISKKKESIQNTSIQEEMSRVELEGDPFTYDIDRLSPYFTAIQKIRDLIGPLCLKYQHTSGFDKYPTPNPHFFVSTRGIFLETIVYYHGPFNGHQKIEEVLLHLYTPFGRVILLGCPNNPTNRTISKESMESDMWELVDVSNRAIIADHAIREEIHNAFSVRGFSTIGNVPESRRKLYLVQSVGDINLLKLEDVQKYFLFYSAHPDKDSMVDMFMNLSNGTNRF